MSIEEQLDQLLATCMYKASMHDFHPRFHSSPLLHNLHMLWPEAIKTGEAWLVVLLVLLESSQLDQTAVYVEQHQLS